MEAEPRVYLSVGAPVIAFLPTQLSTVADISASMMQIKLVANNCRVSLQLLLNVLLAHPFRELLGWLVATTHPQGFRIARHVIGVLTIFSSTAPNYLF